MRNWLVFLGVTGLAFGADVALVEEIVCKVNSDIITRSELERDRREAEAEFRRENLTGRALQEAVSTTTRNLLRDRIDHLLLVQKGNLFLNLLRIINIIMAQPGEQFPGHFFYPKV